MVGIYGNLSMITMRTIYQHIVMWIGLLGAMVGKQQSPICHGSNIFTYSCCLLGDMCLRDVVFRFSIHFFGIISIALYQILSSLLLRVIFLTNS